MRTKVFEHQGTQAVEIPKELAFSCDEVELEIQGDEIILRPGSNSLVKAFEALSSMPSDCFSDGKEDLPQQERQWD